jgi:hypothetical protein
MKLFLNKQITYMKKTILFLSVVVSLMSCGPSNQNPTTVDTKKEGLQSVESHPSQTSKLELLGKYDISSGFLFVYKSNGDTIYIVEGQSQSYPVSITVK